MPHHPLTQNPWSIDTDPELGLVPLAHLHHIDRTRHAIDAIARLVGNSAFEPDATGSKPLDAWTIAALMGGVQSMCDYVGTLTEAMLDQARSTSTDAGMDRSLRHAASPIPS
ncbi:MULTISPECIES: hypothetical protein [Achromobacter]|uniref:Uncharacterized protein n=1 Tax=Achromobacter spanius TaxID=217203 RepID=A0ABY8GVW3_9BURK|nr:MULTISPECIES: hypothetical protein [Achromobacter]WAI81755.1 hypothetical protein N8Z00_19745 [Achromobacter spanius]WEX97273.1 hypothetical protein N3Z32_14355 [Achromobacter sp. SS2-2022]WFP09011.1 hypothetical protein P8T11_03760 [Achromobacter spanius]